MRPEPGDTSGGGAGGDRAASETELVDRFKGALSGVFEPGYLEKLRDEWRSSSSTRAC